MQQHVKTVKKIYNIIRSHYREDVVTTRLFVYDWNGKPHAIAEFSISLDDPSWRKRRRQILEIISRHTQKNSLFDVYEIFSKRKFNILLAV